MTGQRAAREFWDGSFSAQIDQLAYNLAPVEALVRTVSYHLRARCTPHEVRELRFLEIGCGGGANLIWLAHRGLRVAGVDISRTALDLARRSLERAGTGDRAIGLAEASAGAVPFADSTFDGIVEACVFQHLPRTEREAAFAEVHRLLRPSGVFVGYMLARRHTLYVSRQEQESAEDPGTLVLRDGGSPFYLSNLGVSHFFDREEVRRLLAGFSNVDVLPTDYYIPEAEARRRGFTEYLQSMWTVYAVK